MNPVSVDWKRKLLITCAATLAILLAGEATLRLWDYFFRLPYRYFDPDLEMFRLVPGFQTTGNGKDLRINSRGFRAREFTRDKPSDVFRIIMLGDSVTFGLFGEDCYYAGVLQQLFDAEGPGKVEVINTAVEGYNSRDALRLLEGQPGTAITPEEEKAFRRYVPLVYKENLQRIISTARTGGSDAVLFTLPSLLRPDLSPNDMRKLYFPHYAYNLRKFLLLYERYNDTIRSVSRVNSVPVIELQEAFKGRESQLFMDTAHVECEGHKILGEYLHGILSELVPRNRGEVTLSRR